MCKAILLSVTLLSCWERRASSCNCPILSSVCRSSSSTWMRSRWKFRRSSSHRRIRSSTICFRMDWAVCLLRATVKMDMMSGNLHQTVRFNLRAGQLKNTNLRPIWHAFKLRQVCLSVNLTWLFRDCHQPAAWYVCGPSGRMMIGVRPTPQDGAFGGWKEIEYFWLGGHNGRCVSLITLRGAWCVFQRSQWRCLGMLLILIGTIPFTLDTGKLAYNTYSEGLLIMKTQQDIIRL